MGASPNRRVKDTNPPPRSMGSLSPLRKSKLIVCRVDPPTRCVVQDVAAVLIDERVALACVHWYLGQERLSTTRTKAVVFCIARVVKIVIPSMAFAVNPRSDFI